MVVSTSTAVPLRVSRGRTPARGSTTPRAHRCQHTTMRLHTPTRDRGGMNARLSKHYLSKL